MVPARTPRPRLRPGHVFGIPVDEGHIGCGAVVSATHGVYFMAIFEALHSSTCPPPLPEIVSQRPLFLAESLDAKVWHGAWPVLGHLRIDPSQYPAPVSKATADSVDSYFVVSFDRTRRRLATPAEVQRLPFRTTISPQRLENALKAHHGLLVWDPDYDELLFSRVLERAAIKV